jgi:hypothetical protein
LQPHFRLCFRFAGGFKLRSNFSWWKLGNVSGCRMSFPIEKSTFSEYFDSKHKSKNHEQDTDANQKRRNRLDRWSKNRFVLAVIRQRTSELGPDIRQNDDQNHYGNDQDNKHNNGFEYRYTLSVVP